MGTTRRGNALGGKRGDEVTYAIESKTLRETIDFLAKLGTLLR